MKARDIEELLEKLLFDNLEVEKIHICVDNKDKSVIDMIKVQEN